MDQHLRPYLDGHVPESQSPTRLLSAGRADVEVAFGEMVDDTSARVYYPADSDNPVVAPIEQGVYSTGAICPAILGADGRVAMIYPPKVLGDDRIPVGDWTDEVIDMGDAIVEQSQVLVSHKEHLDEIDDTLADVGSAISSWDGRIVDAEQQVSDAKSRATTALDKALEAVQKATEATAAVVKIESSRGTAFKNNQISTDLRVTVFYGTQTITTITGLWEAFGPTAYLEWSWRRETDDGYGLISAADDRLSQSGFCLTVSPDDVDEQTTFRCVLNT